MAKSIEPKAPKPARVSNPIKMKDNKGNIVEIQGRDLPKFLASQITTTDMPIQMVTSPLEMPSGRLSSDEGQVPMKIYPTNPLTQGLRAAKLAIARILLDAGNIEMLETKLKEEFMEDPAAFLRRYEPLLKAYEIVEEKQDDIRKPLHVIVTGDTTINVGSNEKPRKEEIVIDAKVTSRKNETQAPLQIDQSGE